MSALPTAQIATSQDGLIVHLLAIVKTLKQKITDLKKGYNTRSFDPTPTTSPIIVIQTFATPTATISLSNPVAAQSVGTSGSNTFFTKEQLQNFLITETKKASRALVVVDCQPPYPASIVSKSYPRITQIPVSRSSTARKGMTKSMLSAS